MNLLFKKAAAAVAAGIMAVSSLGVESFAESLPKTYSYDLSLEAAVAKPTYQVKGGLGRRRIALTTTTAGATIYYTTNGSVPTTSSSRYTGALIKITSDRKIRAIAVKDGVSSSVMTKTFRVATKYGDVTGDGNINQNDYTKLKNYLAGKTLYVCKDNADCTGDGKVSSKDLTVLQQYLNGSVARLPSAPLASVKKPTATITKIYGGKSVALACSTSDATIYYTTDGSTPTNYSSRYTTPFTLDSSRTVNAIAYKDGQYSKVRTFGVSVGTISPVNADKSTTTTYSGDVSVALSCATANSRIIYTVGDTEATTPDPKTSSSAITYTSAIKLTKDSVIKAYSQAKGYGDSEVYTFSYKVDESFKISGYVWDDTYGSATTANGRKDSGEPGISGIPVYLISASTAVKDASVNYVQRQTTDSTGKYTFDKLSSGQSYKVVFEYNYQKYRAYSSIVTGGNQAIPYVNIDPIYVTDTGVYSVSTYGTPTYINNVMKYSDAITSAYYKMFAATSSTYTKTTEDVSLGLITKNYGVLDLAVAVTGQENGNTLAKGKKLTYTFTLTNNSPLSSTNLVDADLGIYVTNAFNGMMSGKDTTSLSVNYTYTTNGYVYYDFSDFLGSAGLAPGKSVTFSLQGTIDAEAGTEINCYAEVYGYRFSTGCYDYYSAPKTLSIGGTKRERDEAVAPTIRVTAGSTTTNKKLNIGIQQKTVSIGSATDYTFYVINGASLNDINISSLNTTAASYSVSATPLTDMLVVTVTVYGESVGTMTLNIRLAEDTKQSATLTTYVVA